MLLGGPQRRSLPGMFAVVKVILQHKDSVVTLPVEALGRIFGIAD